MARFRTRGIALAMVFALAGCAEAGTRPEAGTHPLKSPRLRTVKTFALALGEGWARGDLSRHTYDLLIIDGQDTDAETVRALRRGGRTVVLAYVSVGTLEEYRPWFAAGRPYRLDRYAPPFDDEFYADTSKAGFRRLILQGVVPPMLAKGFDGLLLDNTDMVESHPRQKAGMRILVGDLSKLVRRQGKLLFSQNGEDSIGPLLRYYDGWNREDVSWTFDGDRNRYRRNPTPEIRENQGALRRIHRAGLLVTATDYVGPGFARATAEAVRNACAAGALPFVSDISLKREPARPFTCPAG